MFVPLYAPMYRGLEYVVSEQRPDVIVSDVVALAAVDVGRRFDIPVVVNVPMPMMPLEVRAAVKSREGTQSFFASLLCFCRGAGCSSLASGVGVWVVTGRGVLGPCAQHVAPECTANCGQPHHGWV